MAACKVPSIIMLTSLCAYANTAQPFVLVLTITRFFYDTFGPVGKLNKLVMRRLYLAYGYRWFEYIICTKKIIWQNIKMLLTQGLAGLYCMGSNDKNRRYRQQTPPTKDTHQHPPKYDITEQTAALATAVFRFLGVWPTALARCNLMRYTALYN